MNLKKNFAFKFSLLDLHSHSSSSKQTSSIEKIPDVFIVEKNISQRRLRELSFSSII